MSSNAREHDVDLVAAVGDLLAPLDVLAILKLADEFYAKEEREKLYDEYQQLCRADEEAFEVMRAAQEKVSGQTKEERVAKHGPVTAALQLTASTKAREARLLAMNAVGEFEKEHPLLIRLLKAKASYSTGR